MFGFGRKILGLDVGMRSIKGVVLAKEGTEVVLKNYFFHDMGKKGHPTQENAHAQELLQAMIDTGKHGKSLVAGCIEDKEIQVVHFSLPQMPDSEIESAVRSTVESKTGKDSSALAIEFINLGKAPSGGPAEILIRAYIAPLELVTDKAAALEACSLQPESIEGCLQATIEALKFNEYISPHDTSVVVDIGESHTSVGLVIGGSLAQLTVIRAGSGDINESLMESFRCDYLESEQMKLNYRLEKSDQESVDHLNRVIEDGYYKIILGVHDTVSYYRAAHKDQLIMNVLLTGGGAQKEGLAALMEQSLGIPVLVPNPLRKIQIFKRAQGNPDLIPEIAPFLHPAIGLALRGIA